MSAYYDREARPISRAEYWRLFQDARYCLVARHEIGTDLYLITIWTGIDYSFGLGNAPVIFETQIFSSGRSLDSRRYSTEAEARAGHEQMREANAAKLAKPSEGGDAA